MATGYGPEMNNDSGRITSYIRYYYSTSYNAATNTSTVTLTPQLYADLNWGNDIRMYGGSSTAGIRVDKSTLWSFTDGYGGSKHLYCTDCDWNNMYANTGATFSFSKTHDNSGNLSFRAGIVGTISGYGPNTSVYDWPTGYEISIHENRQLYVSYNANGGSGAPGATYFYGSTESITLSSTRPTRTGYTFLGWSTSSTATTATYSPGQNIGTRSSGLALYAVWQINTYTISFDANGGEGAPEAVTKTHGVMLTLPDTIPTRAGYDFLGWSTDSSATTATYQAGGSFTANAATTLYAVWRVISYTLSATVSDRGITANILRTASPIGGAASGLLSNGDTVYYNDVIKVSWAISGGYQAETLQINGEDVSLLTEKTITVTERPVVILVVELGAMVYIANDMYQAFINDGTGWSQYQAYIGNGSSWDAY